MPRTEICDNDASRLCYDGAIIQGSYRKRVMAIQGDGNFFTDKGYIPIPKTVP
ncbi:MAG: hypothetical protein ACJ0BN_12920 [Limisphaerales bacterium]|nr:hypothetical protein [Verrucomicrobiae bacterium]